MNGTRVMALCLSLLAVLPLAMADEAPPNILVLMSDDLGWGDLGCHGHPFIQTPYLDAMAAEGMRFTRFYAAAPNDMPTRIAFFTGRHPARWGTDAMYWFTLPEDVTTLAEALQAADYRTGHFGKWQLGAVDPEEEEPNWGKRQYHQFYSPPSAHGFDTYFSTRCSVPTFDPEVMPEGWGDPRVRDGEPFPAGFWDESGTRVTAKLRGDTSRMVVDRAIPFIRDAVANEQPFFAAVCFHAPHAPYVAGPKHRALYTEHSEKAQHYFGSITAMDDQIGRLREVLQEVGAAENTLVMFLSDNGPRGKRDKPDNGSTGHLRGRKNTLYEGGIRVPALAVWPAVIAPGTVSETPVSVLDIMPTLLEAIPGATVPKGQPLDGESFLPLLRNEPWIRAQPLYFAYFGSYAAVTATHKLLLLRDAPRWLFFDLLQDPGESRDVAREQELRMQRLRDAFETWREKLPVFETSDQEE